MYPLFTAYGTQAGVQAAVNGSHLVPEIKAFITTRLSGLFGYVRVVVTDNRAVYDGTDSKQTNIEVASVPAPLG